MLFGVDPIRAKLVVVTALDDDIACVFRKQVFLIPNTGVIDPYFTAAIY